MIEETLKIIDDHKLLALIRTSTSEDAESVLNALIEGGIRLLKVSVNVPQVFKLIENYSKKEGLLIGASSVIDGEVAQRAVNAGARFIVTPYTDKDVISVCKNNGTAVIQAAATPTEAVNAYRMGVDLIEIYPVDLLGGPSYVKALKGPLPFLKLVPSGGITVENALDYLKQGVSAIVISGGVIEKGLIRANNWEAIRERAKLLSDKLESLKVPR